MTSHTHDEVGIAWRGLSAWSKKKISQGFLKRQKVERKCLLNSVSGYARAGALTAVMGASGAGKTTLISTVSGRASGYERSGEVLANGRPISAKHMIKISGFVPQHDIAVEELTTLEHMQFMAWLKMDALILNKEKNRVIDQIVSNLGLQKCIGSQLKVLSGGERRRVALAVQLLNEPPVLFCDEPTTGLDSFGASSVVSCLSQQAKSGKTVVCTIHQPSSGILEHFDEVILMAAGGRLSFQGTVNDALDHFKALGVVFPKSFNSAELLISQLAVREGVRTEEEVRQICDRFGKSISYAIFTKKFNQVNALWRGTEILNEESGQFRLNSRRRSDLTVQFRLLLWRLIISTRRNSNTLAIDFILRIVAGFFVGGSFNGATTDSNAVQNLQGFFTYPVVGLCFVQASKAISGIHTEKSLVLQETKDSIYSVGPYYLSRTVFIVLWCIITGLVYSITVCLAAGINYGPVGFISGFYNPLIASCLAFSALGACLAASFESMEVTTTCIVPLHVFSYMFSGTFMQLSSLPFYLRLVKYVCPIYYGVEAMSIWWWTSVDKIPCARTPGVACPTTADEVLAKYGYKRSNIDLDFFGLALIFLVFSVIGYIALKRRVEKNKLTIEAVIC